LLQSPSDAVSTITFVEFKSAAIISTTKFPSSIVTDCSENPDEGALLLATTFCTLTLLTGGGAIEAYFVCKSFAKILRLAAADA
jgi:hypothetical protein